MCQSYWSRHKTRNNSIVSFRLEWSEAIEASAWDTECSSWASAQNDLRFIAILEILDEILINDIRSWLPDTFTATISRPLHQVFSFAFGNASCCNALGLEVPISLIILGQRVRAWFRCATLFRRTCPSLTATLLPWFFLDFVSVLRLTVRGNQSKSFMLTMLPIIIWWCNRHLYFKKMIKQSCSLFKCTGGQVDIYIHSDDLSNSPFLHYSV